MSKFLAAAAFLGSAVFAFQLLGPLSPSATNLLVFLFLLLFVWAVLPGPTRLINLAISLSLACILGLAYLTLSKTFPPIRVLSIAAFSYLLAANSRHTDSEQTALCSIAGLTGFTTAVLYAVYTVEPWVWFVAQRASKLGSELVGVATGQRLSLSATASGLWVFLLFLAFGTFAFFLSSPRRWKDLLIYAFGLLLGNLLFVAGLHSLSNWFGKLAGDIPVHPMKLLPLAFLLSCLPLYFFIKRVSFRAVSLKLTATFAFATAVVITCFLLSAALLFLPTKLDHQKPRTVLIDSKGYFNWEKPSFGRYGLTSAGMFGMLPHYLRSLGYTVQIDSSFSPGQLHGVGVVVLINLNEMIPSGEKESLQNFVREGGSLLVMGDHTGLGGIMEPLNQVIDFLKIRFKFDSAHYLRKDWMGAFQFLPHPVFRNVRDEVDVGISVGASLDLSPIEARPVLIAKYGFSDWGNPLNSQNAYLGDRTYNPGELLGDIVLVAEAQHGKGKVLVFGDTSSFQNGTLTYSFTFVRNVFDYLTSGDVGWAYGVRRVASLCFLVLGLLFLFVFCKPLVQPSSVLCVSILMVITMLLFSPEATPETRTLSTGWPTAYIDASHLNRFSQYGDDGIWALSHNLMRNEYLPFVHRRFSPEALKQSKIAFFISPARDLTPKETEEVSRFVQEGGTAVWSVGYEEKETSRAVLQDFGFELDNTPLGPVPVKETSAGIQFHKAWPILLRNPETVDTICTGWNYPVIVSRTIRKGRFVLISDPSFLLSENVESQQGYVEANILFMRKFLREIKEN